MKKLALIFVLLIAISGTTFGISCQLTTPIISIFDLTPSTINTGGSATLSWNVISANSVTIDPDIGNVALAGSRTVSPSSTTTYIITATNNVGTITSVAVLTVIPQPIPTPTPAPTAPIVTVFTINPPAITMGQSAIMQWSVTGATSVRIDPAIGSVASSGSLQVSPASTTTYTLTAFNGSLQTSVTTTLTVNPIIVSPPTVVSFSVMPSTIFAGQYATLQWNVTGANSVFIDNGIGNVSPTGSQVVSPVTTTTYIITASNGAGTVTSSTILYVNQAPPVPPPGFLPVIISFDANPPIIGLGGSITLQWQVTGAASVTIDQFIGPVPTTGSLVVSPTFTTVYTLTASNIYGFSTQTAIVVVTPTSGLPIILAFNASPSTITMGQSATLQWNVAGATSVSISNGIGAVISSGTRSVTPSTTTTYVLSATNAVGTMTSSATVTVNPSSALPMVILFTASPDTINSGQTSALIWSVSGSLSISINNSIGLVSPSGTVLITPASTTTYSLTATNLAGSVTVSVTITVNPPPSLPFIITFTTTPMQINSGQTSTLIWNVSGATSISINQGIGSVPATGTRNITPSSTTTYILTATNASGVETHSVTVVVNQ